MTQTDEPKKNGETEVSTGEPTSPDTSAAPDAEVGGQPEAPEEAVAAADAAESERVAALQAEVERLKNELLYARAEVDNVIRRSAREREDTARYAPSALARSLLSVADNLRRAIESVPAEAREDDAVKALLTGVEMTERELLSAFDSNNIKRIDPLGERFNHDFHQAMFEVEDPSQPAGTVVQVLQPGYILHDRLLRPAMVGVSKGGPKPDTQTKVDTQA